MNKFITGVVMCAISFQAVAESELEQKVKSIVVLKKYTETVACGTNFEDERPLEEFLKHTFTANEGHSYYILWQGDIGCAGGSGTTSFYISEVARDTDTRPFLVKTLNAFGKDFEDKVNTRFIENVTMVSSEHFSVVSSEFSEDDSNNFPSQKFRYEVKRSNAWDTEWKVASKEKI